MYFRTWPLVAAFMAAPAVISHESSYMALNFHFPNTTSPKRFEIQVNQDFIDLTLRKVRDYRPSPSVFSNWTIEGPPKWAMTSLADYWAENYQWSATEKRINQFDHYATTVPGSRNYSAPIPLHFVHQRSNNSDDTPLLLLHIPDLPGYGSSPAPTEPSMGPGETGAALDRLIKQLGYETYGIVSTDLGWALGMWMAADFPDSLTGLFTDFYRVPPLPSDISRQTVNQTTKEENEYILVSNVYAISDGYSYTYNELITDVLLWIQSSYSSMRSWLEFYKPEALMFPRTDVPTGITHHDIGPNGHQG
ncbi:hypothetical protein NM208_g1952 [Fusarium decemcellulare]|uniref:Uncharacterized protein n=1 Tax=Fusarium decemcellulare TaxID=57161 RepID=A0ACC1SUE8_9HYPO|nr:hypothetical protein NM208_g1952 [Fusarium decemcellulare]